MNTNRKIAVITLTAVLALTNVSAQSTDKKEKTKKKNQTITIVRSGDADEKLIVEVVGDKITVNGKPVEEYKGDVEVITGSSNDVYKMVRPGRLNAMKAPMAIAGVDGNHLFSWNSNAAVLGVNTEDGEGGAKITEVSEGSAAEKAGLKAGDIITKVNEFNVADADDLPMAIQKFKPEDKVTITYKRDGKEQTASALLEKNDHSFGKVFSGQHIDHDFNFDFDHGQGTKTYAFSRKPRLGVQIEDQEDGKGVKVLEVNAETPAGKAGLQKDDVITAFNGKDIKGVDDIRNAMKEVKEGETVKMSYQRAGAVQTADITFPKAVKKASL